MLGEFTYQQALRILRGVPLKNKIKIVIAQYVIPFVYRIRSEAITRVLVFPPVNNYHRFLIHKVGRWVDAPTGSNWQTNIVMLSKLLFFLPHTNQKMNMVMFPQQKIVEMLLRAIFCNINCCALQ